MTMIAGSAFAIVMAAFGIEAARCRERGRKSDACDHSGERGSSPNYKHVIFPITHSALEKLVAPVVAI